MTRRAIILSLCGLCLLAARVDRSSAGQLNPTLLVPGSNQGGLVKLRGNTRPEATAINDRGPVADDFQLQHMMLLLRRSSQQEEALEQFLGQLSDPNSPNFHRWLTAEQFGQAYGLPEEALDSIAQWLESYGFTVNGIYSNRVLIDFSGTARQVYEAFHTEIHHLLVNGKYHIANMSDPEIPAQLAPAVAGVVSLNDFMPRPVTDLRPDYTFSGSCGLISTCYLVVPADLATIYNFNPVYAAGYSGQGQTIVVIEDTDVYSTSDWDTFRSTFGLASAYPAGSFSQVHPPPEWGTTNCTDPGVDPNNIGADGEAILDAEWASAAAPNANIVLASCNDATTSWSSTPIFGGFTALQNLLDSTAPPAIVSISYAWSETKAGVTQNAAISSMYQQAVAEGVSVFVAAGDWGAATSDVTKPPSAYASYGINVNAFASTPYNVAVGGTDFDDTNTRTNSTYWGATNSTNYGSALSYIPEIAWNDTCASALTASYLGVSGGTYGTSSLCNSSLAASHKLLNVIAGGGGPSACSTGLASTSGVVSGTCEGYAKPAWQSVLGNPSDGVRDIPDISLFASNGPWGHKYVFCYSDPNPDFGGAPCSGAPDTWSSNGGTSFAAPIMAALQSLVNQASGSRAGNPNPAYYALAASEYGSSGSSSCNSSLGNGVASTCVFYDVTQGDMDVPCEGSNDCYLPSGTYGVLSTSSAGPQPAYGTNVGWDFATGIGTVNAYNFVKALGVPPTTAVRLSPPSLFLGAEPVGTNSLPRTVTLSNTGNASLSISSYTISGANFGDFSVYTSCTGALAPGNSCSFNFNFDPTAAGPRKAVFVVNDNAPNSPQSIPLTGVGMVATVSPAALGFVSRTVGTTSGPMNATITNNSSVTMHIWQIAIAGANAGDFSISSTTCGSILAVGTGCTVSVTFTPTAVGARRASLLFSDDGAGSPQAVMVTGGGLDNVITIGTGHAVNGNLSPTAPAGHCNYGAPSDRYLLDLSGQGAPTVVTFLLTSAAFDSFVCVLDASNNLLAQDDDSAGNLNSTTMLSLSPAKYYVEATSFSGTGSGSYTLSALVATIVTPGTLSLGNRVVASLTSSAAYGVCSQLYHDPADRWTFALTATTTITIDVSSTSFQTTACLLNSGNQTIGFDDTSGPGANARLIKNLGVGTYYLEVSSHSSPFAGGPYTLSLQSGLPPGKPTSLSSTLNGHLSPAAAYGVCSQLYHDPADRWTFALTAITTITIDVSSTSFQTTACLLDSGNNTIGFDDTSGPGANARLIKNLGVGTYYLEVSSHSSPFAGGPYTLSLQSGLPPGTPISLGQTVPGNLLSSAAYGVCSQLYHDPADRWTFTLTAITTITIDVSSTSFQTTACLLDSGNNTIGFDDTSGPGANARLIKNLGVGTYYLEVSCHSSPFAGGPYTLSLQSGLPPGTPISLGQTLPGNLLSSAAYGVCSQLYHDPADRWQFMLSATTTITIGASSTVFSPTVCLLDSANSTKGFKSASSGSGTATLSESNLGAGTYYIEVSSANSPFAGGAYTLSLQTGAGSSSSKNVSNKPLNGSPSLSGRRTVVQ